jgi:GT2 family glycosyltransferase
VESKEILFVVPTIMNRPDFEIDNLESVAKQFPNQRFLFICNTEDISFSEYVPKYPNIEKLISGIPFSISAAINLGIDNIFGERYFCFLQSDVYINRQSIECIKNLCSDPTLNVGVIGITKHSNFKPYSKNLGLAYSLNIYRVLWVDGIMFFKTSILKDIAYFDMRYFGDKESQDFCYRVHKEGYSNYYVEVASNDQEWYHKSLEFKDKAKSNNIEFLNLRKKSVSLFSELWHEWEKTQEYLFV